MSTPTTTHSLWWRWSWRDLRAHWVAVITIALIIALGTGLYAGLGSTSKWRQLAYDGSFAALELHDVRLEMPSGSFTGEGQLLAAVAEPRSADENDVTDLTAEVHLARERLVVGTQVDTGDTLVSGRLIGGDLTATAPDGLWVSEGRLPTPGNDPPEVLLETKFAEHYDIEPGATLLIGGDQTVRVSGHGMAPEEFWVRGPEGSFMGHVDLGTMYADLATVQALAGRPGQVNDLVVSLDDAVDAEAAEAAMPSLVDAVRDRAGIAVTATSGEESYAWTVLNEDVENDQAIFNAISVLILGAAALAAFNLISRIVETQRHEIGIGLALGVNRVKLGLRPVLVGLQVGIIGTIAGVAVGGVVGSMMGDLLDRFTPLPDSPTPFQYGTYAQGAILGVVPPVVAAVVAVMRTVRVEPVDALRTGHLASTGRLAGWANRITLPGDSINQMPIRNTLRAPRRTLFTALGVGAAITALVGVLGLLDSFENTVDTGIAEVTSGDPDRVVVALDTYYPVTDPVVEAVASIDEVGASSAGLRVQGEVWHDDEVEGSFPLLLEILDLDNPVWAPRLVDAGPTPSDGVILARKAASDLGVDVGDVVSLRHPIATAAGPSIVVSEIEVTALHPAPLRTLAYLGSGFAEQFGLSGFANTLQITPADEVDRETMQRAVFGLEGVASAQPVSRVGEVFEQTIDEFIGILYIAAGAVLLLALLIAFNSSRIGLEERRREHATMMAFGIPVHSVLATVVWESIVVGALATIVGIGAGLLSVRWILTSLVGTSFPEFAVALTLAPASVMIATAVGVVAVALAPLLLTRRLQRMDLPSTLRVLE